jgi:anti-sigma regulatory factor (Ser/Thr protein kinase)
MEKLGQTLQLTKKCVFEINLALDELFTNIISYGFEDDDEHEIKVTLTPENEIICLCIEDDGQPFNPIEAKKPDLECTVEDCKIGGLGIHLIRNLMDDICYERCGDKNVLTLKKSIQESEKS